MGLNAGVGIASGPTFCAPAGNQKRQDFAMLGSHVNLAARLMQAAEDGAVLCDAETQAEARREPDLRPAPGVRAQGARHSDRRLPRDGCRRRLRGGVGHGQSDD